MVEKVTKTDLEALEKRLKTQLEEDLTNRLDMVEKAHKMQVKTLFSTIETMSSAMNLMEKQFNMKIGGIQGNLNRKPRRSEEDEDVLMEFENIEQLMTFAKEHGLKPKEQKELTKEENPLDYVENPLLDK